MTFADQTQARVGAEESSGVPGGGLECDGRRDSRCHPELQFALDRRSMKNQKIAGVAAGHQCHAALVGPPEILDPLVEDPSHRCRVEAWLRVVAAAAVALRGSFSKHLARWR